MLLKCSKQVKATLLEHNGSQLVLRAAPSPAALTAFMTASYIAQGVRNHDRLKTDDESVGGA